MAILTKSKYLEGLQCLRLVWTEFHEPEKIPEPDESTKQRFATGQEIGEYAKKLFLGGIDIPTQDFHGNIQETQSLLNEEKPLFEAGFLVNDLYSRVDILVPNSEGFDIVEVKSGTHVKEVNIQDVAFQKHCCELAGLKIKNCYVMHLNNEYVRNGEIEVEKLFVKKDITEEVNNILPEVPRNIDRIRDAINSPVAPNIGIGEQCNNPYECPLIKECWSFLPEDHVLQLYRGKKKAFELINGKVYSLSEIPEDFELNEKQRIQVNGKEHIDKQKISQFLNGLTYPLYFLDFEAINSAVPLFDNSRPYQHIPFQYSLHIVDKDWNIEHHSFLYQGNKDPRKEFISSLEKMLGTSGSIIVYNESFEKKILRELAEIFPEYQDFVNSVLERIVDLLIPFRNFYYYHPKQKGSASIKNVLPALVGEDYSELEIGKGDIAALEYHRVTYTQDNSDKEKVYSDLLDYCKLDTLGMVWIVQKLKSLVDN